MLALLLPANRALRALLAATLAATLAVLLAPATCAAAGLSARDLAALRDDGRVGAAVVEGLAAGEHVRVMIAFDLGKGRQAHDLAPKRRSQVVGRARGALLASLPPASFALKRAYRHVGAVAGRISAAGLRALLANPAVVRVDEDAPGSGTLVQALPLARLTDVKNLGYTGKGVTTAVIDSGIDTDHADLADSLAAQACFCSGGGGCCPGGGATASGPGSAEDDNGHGTNVAGIVTGNGSKAPQGGAPDAGVVAVKVLDAGNAFCCASDVVAALDRILDHHAGVRVLNLSLGTNALFTGNCDSATSFTMAFASVIRSLRDRGALTFVSTGNQGSPDQLAAPACVSSAIAVGAVWDANLGGQAFLGCSQTSAVDRVTCFTNSSPTMDLVAPGAYTTATGRNGASSTYGGTSQASPAAAACAAALLEARPDLTANEMEAALESSPVVVTDSKNGLAFPRLDCLAALESVATTTTTTTVTTTTTTTSTSTTTTTLPPSLCGPAPIEPAACRAPGPRGAVLRTRRSPDPWRRRLHWSMRRGPATFLDELPDPLASAATHYSLCLYDSSGRPQPRAELAVAGSGTCGGAACWSSDGTGELRYRRPGANAHGVTAVRLGAGDEGRAFAAWRAAGARLPLPRLALEFPVTVQIVGRRGQQDWCRRSHFPEAARSGSGRMKAVSR